jgi:hypothetical protein
MIVITVEIAGTEHGVRREASQDFTAFSVRDDRKACFPHGL